MMLPTRIPVMANALVFRIYSKVSEEPYGSMASDFFPGFHTRNFRPWEALHSCLKGP